MRRILTAFVLGIAACGSGTLDELEPAVFQIEPTYESHIRPLLAKHCVRCHSSSGIRVGGVELDRYESAHSNRVRNVCVSVTTEIIERFAGHLKPEPRDGRERPACEGWTPYNMPPGAAGHLTLEEQIVLARWVELGAPR